MWFANNAAPALSFLRRCGVWREAAAARGAIRGSRDLEATCAAQECATRASVCVTNEENRVSAKPQTRSRLTERAAPAKPRSVKHRHHTRRKSPLQIRHNQHPTRRRRHGASKRQSRRVVVPTRKERNLHSLATGTAKDVCGSTRTPEDNCAAL